MFIRSELLGAQNVTRRVSVLKFKAETFLATSVVDNLKIHADTEG